MANDRLFGRVDELATLESFLAGGDLFVLVVRGEAGIGKSTLVQALSIKAGAWGWRVLQCSGVEAEAPFVLAGLSQLVYPLRDFMDRLGVGDQHTLRAALGAPSDTAPSASALTFALLRLLTAAGDAEPLLVILDDAHWFDDVSARVVAMAGRRLDAARVRLIAVCRNEFPNPLADGGWPQMPLGPLDADQSASFLDELGVKLGPAARVAVLEQAAGNPLALAELPRSAAESKGNWNPDTPLPLTERMVAIFGGRLQNLDEHARAELLCGALDGVATGGVGSAVVRTRYVMRGVEAALEYGMVVIDDRGEMVFRHPLVRAAVIQASTANQRRAAHALLAGLYPDDVIRRAAHLADATVDPDQAVADTLAEAADLTVRRGGARQAVELLRRAVELSKRPRRREQLLADAAFIATQAARLDDVERLVDEVGHPSAATALLTSSYLALYRDGDVTATHRRLVERLRSPEDLDDETLTRMVHVLLTVSLYGGDAVHGAITDNLIDTLAGRLGEVTLLCRDAWADAARRGHHVRQRLSADLIHLPDLEPWDVMRLAAAAHFVGMLDDFRAALARMVDRELHTGATTNAMVMLHLITIDQLASGQWAAALHTGQRGLALATQHDNELFTYHFKSHLGVLAACRGDVEAACELAAEIQTWARPRRVGLLLGYAQQIAVLCGLAEADYESAYVQAQAITGAGEFPPYSHHATQTMLDFVEAAVHSERLEQARAHVCAAERLGLANVSPGLVITIGGAAAMCAPDEQALGLFEKILGHPALDSFPFEQARIRLAYGMRLRRLRRHTDARIALDAAAEIFAGLGAEPWERRARNEARATGPGGRHSTTDGSARLSAQERRIAELAAQGLTNKEIAAQLFLSPRTVGAHLYRLFPKLGVTTRSGLHDALKALDTAQHTIESSD